MLGLRQARLVRLVRTIVLRWVGVHRRRLVVVLLLNGVQLVVLVQVRRVAVLLLLHVNCVLLLLLMRVISLVRLVLLLLVGVGERRPAGWGRSCARAQLGRLHAAGRAQQKARVWLVSGARHVPFVRFVR